MELIISLSIIAICYTVLLWQYRIAFKQGCSSTADVVLNGGCAAVLNHRHLVSGAVMLLAIVYLTAVNGNPFILKTSLDTSMWTGLFTLGITAGIFSVFSAVQVMRKNKLRGRNTESMQKYLAIRFLFIIGYELFFRGVLLQFCILLFEVWVAIVTNIVLYVVAHIFSSRQEFWGTIPFGALLCFTTLFSGSVWPAIFLHLLLALPYDILLLSASKFSTKTFIS